MLNKIFLRNNWIDPVENIELFFSNPYHAVVSILENKYSDLAPLFLVNYHFFSKLTFDDLSRVINTSISNDDKFKLDLINLIDFYYKFIEIDLLSSIHTMEKVDVEKRKDIIKYFYDTPGCLFVSSDQKKQVFNQFGVSEEKVKEYTEQLISEGARRSEEIKMLQKKKKGINILYSDNDQHSRLFKKYNFDFTR